jgi:DUF3095 family protein
MERLLISALSLQPFTDFAFAFDASRYRPIPGDWSVAVSDVVNSTDAIARGAYKDVNMAGAATIAGILNACARDDLPFAFGGDAGMVFLPPEFEAQTRAALSGVKRMCADILNLNLRCSLIPVAELRKRGKDALVAAHDLGSGRILAMLAGGGIEIAERLCKAPEGASFAIPIAEGECDLTGLSCRWEPLNPEHGAIMALVVHAHDSESVLPAIYRDIYAKIGGVTGAHASPAKPGAFSMKWPSANLEKEVAFGGAQGRLKRRVRILMEGAFTLLSLANGKTYGGFNARTYRDSLPVHSDYRKYADSLRMVIDCTPAQADAIEAMLDAEWRNGAIDYGTHIAKAALMTCFVRNTEDAGHVHFIDGADGGYALAALDMKKRMAGTKA